MATFLLIHGSWQGAWCWREVVPRLQSCGHRTVAIDLPGHGDDPSSRESIVLHDYVAATVRALDGIEEVPILVGHSMGGIISAVAEAAPHRMRALVYVCALLLPTGASMLQTVGDFDPDYLAQIEWAEDRRTAMLTPRGATDFWYALCPPGTVRDAIARFTPEPAAPFETVLQLTPEGFGKVARYYIECLRDRVIPIGLQRKMCSVLPCRQVFSIDTDHSPFFSAPDELVAILHKIATEA